LGSFEELHSKRGGPPARSPPAPASVVIGQRERSQDRPGDAISAARSADLPPTTIAPLSLDIFGSADGLEEEHVNAI
jgi:hypothetical protein